MNVSIVIPCYNVEHYVAEAINSALAQLEATEIILVDNNSTDGTMAILQAYARKYPRRIQVCQEAQQGAPAARNLGLSKVSNPLVQFLDADDLLLPGKLARQVAMLREAPNCFLAGAYTYRYLNGREKDFIPMGNNPWIGLCTDQIGITSSNLFPVELLHKVGGWKVGQQSGQEVDLMFRLMKSGIQVLTDVQPTALVRRRPSGQISFSDAEGNLACTLLIFLEVKHFLSKHQPQIWHRSGEDIDWWMRYYLRRLSKFSYKRAVDFEEKFFGRVDFQTFYFLIYLKEQYLKSPARSLLQRLQLLHPLQNLLNRR